VMAGLGDGCETRGRVFLTGGAGATTCFVPGGGCCGTETHTKQSSSACKIGI
jgi:hypothetical protein